MDVIKFIKFYKSCTSEKKQKITSVYINSKFVGRELHVSFLSFVINTQIDYSGFFRFQYFVVDSLDVGTLVLFSNFRGLGLGQI